MDKHLANSYNPPMLGRAFRFICYGFAGVIVIGILFTVMMPYIFPVFAGEKLEISIVNRSAREISALVEIADLDTNRSELKNIEALKSILPGKTAITELWLDGWTPEACVKILIRSQGLEKTFDCGIRERIDGRFQTRADLVFND
jgi:hypothetical protein